MTRQYTSNSDLVLCALYRLDGHTRAVETEALFVAACDLIPERLGLSAQAIPDKRKCIGALRRLETCSPAKVIRKSACQRQITRDGWDYLKGNWSRLEPFLGPQSSRNPDRIKKSYRSVTQALNSEVFRLWMNQGLVPGEKSGMAQLLNCSEDTDGESFYRQMQALRYAAFSSGQDEVVMFLDAVERQHLEWF